jgi:hypothetical protein
MLVNGHALDGATRTLDTCYEAGRGQGNGDLSAPVYIATPKIKLQINIRFIKWKLKQSNKRKYLLKSTF